MCFIFGFLLGSKACLRIHRCFVVITVYVVLAFIQRDDDSLQRRHYLATQRVIIQLVLSFMYGSFKWHQDLYLHRNFYLWINEAPINIYRLTSNKRGHRASQKSDDFSHLLRCSIPLDVLLHSKLLRQRMTLRRHQIRSNWPWRNNIHRNPPFS
jgi:hypothetical protein